MEAAQARASPVAPCATVQAPGMGACPCTEYVLERVHRTVPLRP